MLRVFLLLLAMSACGCVLDRGEDRRPEILPGRYRATQGNVQAEYDFQADGSFYFMRTEGGKTTLTETGHWEYRYDGPDERYLIESEVTRRDLGSDSVWQAGQNRGYQYRIDASTAQEFYLNPGSDDGHLGPLIILSLIFGSPDVVFQRL